MKTILPSAHYLLTMILRYGRLVEIDTNALQSVLRSAEAVHENLSQGNIVYGEYIHPLQDSGCLLTTQ